MEAGRELDQLVAEKVMRHLRLKPLPPEDPRLYVEDPLPYSTNIAAAWEVMDNLRQRGLTIALYYSERGCTVQADARDQQTITRADTAPLAICLAGLNTVELSAVAGGIAK